MNNNTALSVLSLGDARVDALRSRGIGNVEQLSDLLHGSAPSRESVRQLLGLDATGLCGLVAAVDQVVEPSTNSSKIGRLGAVHRRPEPEGKP